jgi:ComF family protein
MKALSWYPQQLLTLFLKTECPLCQRPTHAEFCPNCQRHLQQSQLTQPAQFWHPQPGVFAWGRYEGSVKQAIAALKYHHHPEVARPLGQWLAQAWLTSGVAKAQRLTIVPIPLHPDKYQQRGYNQAELIAQSFCQFTGYPHRAHGLARIRATEAQFHLSATQRAANLAQAFAVGKDLRNGCPHPVLLVDDIYTTGATVKAAIQTFHRQGISVRGVVVVAKADMRRAEANQYPS